MINCAFLIFNNCDQWIKDSIKFSSRWFCSLNFIDELKKMDNRLDWEEHCDKIFQTSLDNRVVDWYRLFHEWEHLYSEIHYLHPNPGSESMHSCDINVDYKWVIMCNCTAGLMKINTYNLRAPICTVPRNKITCFITSTFLNTSNTELT